MGYVLVSADFPNVDSEQRKKIYECLTKKNWTKVTEPARDISTTWFRYFSTESEARAISIAIESFQSCSKPYCVPKLVLQWGPNHPVFSGLDKK